MHITYIRDDSTVYNDGVSYILDTNPVMDRTIRAIQYDVDVGGHIEYDGWKTADITPEEFNAQFGQLITLWNEANDKVLAAKAAKDAASSKVAPTNTGFKAV